MIIESTHYKKKIKFINEETFIINRENNVYKEFTNNNNIHIKSVGINNKLIPQKKKRKIFPGKQHNLIIIIQIKNYLKEKEN